MTTISKNTLRNICELCECKRQPTENQPTWADEVRNGTQSKAVAENIGKDGKDAEIWHPGHGIL
jgi:hypothetical protein